MRFTLLSISSMKSSALWPSLNRRTNLGKGTSCAAQLTLKFTIRAMVNSSIMSWPPRIVLARWNAFSQFLIPAAQWLKEVVQIVVNASIGVERG
jgi:phage baseplate assembly protein W